MRYARIVAGICFAGMVAGLMAPPLWPRLMGDQSLVDVREQADKAPVLFRGRVLTVGPDPDRTEASHWVDGKPVNTNFVATFAVDRIYRGKLVERAAVHFSLGELGLMGHDCIDFRPGQYWLIFGVERKGLLQLIDDCTGALGISSLLGPKASQPGWSAQMEADFIAGLGDPNLQSRLFSLQRLGGLKLASSRPVLRQVIQKGSEPEAEWAVYAALRSGDVSVLPLVRDLLKASHPSVLQGDIAYELQKIDDPTASSR